MKGTIAVCLEEMIRQNFGQEAWNQVCEAAGLPVDHRFRLSKDVPDGDVVALIGVAARTLGVSEKDAMHAFGIHWSTTYAPKIYGHFFKRAQDARSFLLSMDKVHDVVTKTVKDAAPPRFSYDESDPHGLVMHYSSARGMVALMPGLVEGVAKYYGEDVDIRVSGNSIHIDFVSARKKAA